ncbi:MAG: gfo/Idh/MocA family oxidoreductase [Planctomycetia bacterium]|nr:gfo/Idh/MocA family oxidoreductase [Planctomycetia bacterium]
MRRLRVAVVGCGHLGAIHARLLAAREDAELVAVVDPAPDFRGRTAQLHGCAALADPRELLGLADAAVVAAPTGLHASVSLPLLEGGVDLLVEKPLAATVEEARSIVVAARRQGRIVAVGHVERFNPAWRLAVEKAGRITAVESARLAPFTFRSMDVGVVLDLMIHDIDLVLALEPGRLERVEARGIVATGGHEDAVRARLVFSGGLIADLSASRIHPTVRRSVSLWSNESMVSVDFNAKTVEVISPSDAVRGGTFVAAEVPAAGRAALKDSFFTDVLPRRTLPVPEANAIACEHDDFLSAVRERRQPTVPASAGAAALEIAARLLDAMVCHRFGAAAGAVGPAFAPGLRGRRVAVLRPELRRKTG